MGRSRPNDVERNILCFHILINFENFIADSGTYSGIFDRPRAWDLGSDLSIFYQERDHRKGGTTFFEGNTSD